MVCIGRSLFPCMECFIYSGGFCGRIVETGLVDKFLNIRLARSVYTCIKIKRIIVKK